MFFPRGFIVLGLTFKSLIYFDFIFVYDIRQGYNLIFLHVDAQFSHYHLLKKLCFPHCVCIDRLAGVETFCYEKQPASVDPAERELGTKNPDFPPFFPLSSSQSSTFKNLATRQQPPRTFNESKQSTSVDNRVERAVGATEETWGFPPIDVLIY